MPNENTPLKAPAQREMLLPGSTTTRWLLVGLLVSILFLAGVYDAQIFAFLTTAWQKALAAVGLSRQAEMLQQGINSRVTRRALPAVLTYAALYIGLCILLLRLLVRDPLQWQLVLRLYAGIIAAYVVIVVVGKLAGDALWAYRLSRHLIDFLVGPLPVAGLLVLFRAGLGPRSAATTR